MKKVRMIPPVPKEYKKLKVAAYCRVSTFRPAQLHSLEMQIKTYKSMIRSHPDWIYVGVFYAVDSGLRWNGRTGLNKMLKKAAKGKIDYIITKSISRVSRDTLELLKIIRWNTSENIQWGFQRKFEKGDIFTNYKNFMGYTCVDGEIKYAQE